MTGAADAGVFAWEEAARHASQPANVESEMAKRSQARRKKDLRFYFRVPHALEATALFEGFAARGTCLECPNVAAWL